VGSDRRGVPIRDRRGERFAERPLSGGRSQLLVYHFMFGGRLCGWVSVLLGDRGTGSTPPFVHLGEPRRHASWRCRRATASRSCRRFKRRMGWTFSLGVVARRATSTFDFNVSVTEEQQRRGGRRIQL